MTTTSTYLYALTRAFKSTLLACILLTALATVSFAQHATVKGRVKDGEIALSNATVSMGSNTSLTNSKGEFSFALPAGTHTLTVTHVGYKKIEQQIILTAGETKPITIGMIRNEQLSEVVVLGSRSAIQRSSLNTAVPVDIISSNYLKATGQYSLIQMMNFAAPSFNVSRQSLWEPVTLRGLGPDHLLILLNGTRYLPTAYIHTGVIRGTLGMGAVGNDVNSIPFAAIEKIEILRDGASAQYGSDAIAGVMNIELKKTTGKTFINLQLGQHYKGDGESGMLGINHGIKLNNKNLLPNRQGYLNFSGDFRYRKPTHRGGVYEGTVYYNIPTNATPGIRDSITALDNKKIAERGFSRKTPVSNDGSIKLSSFGFLINGGYAVNNKVELFWTGSINYRYPVNQGMYRYPKTTSQVNTNLYPDGFKVKAIINSRDISAIAGARGKTNNGWNWEWNSVFGHNTNRQGGKNTNNASQYLLGANAPTEFYGGTQDYTHQINYISFAKDLAKQIGRVKSFTLGLGAEYRFENYCTKAGEEAAWKDYDSSGPRMGGAIASGGINPNDVVNESRGIAGLYVDVETDVNDHLLINVASRLEYNNHYGNNLAGKLAMRYKFSSLFLLRGSVSNGYHAPALQQFYTMATNNPAWRNGIAVTNGIFPNNHAVTKAFGVTPLQPEKALNMSGGFTSRLSPHINITVDAYWIQITNRIVLSGIFDRNKNGDANRVLQDYPNIDQVQFVTNAINTKTRGIDIVTSGAWPLNQATVGFTAAANFTQTKLFGGIQTTDKLSGTANANTLFNREERERIENGQPASKIILSATYKKGKTAFLLRSTRFGKTSVVLDSDDTSRDEFFSPKILTDLSFTHTPKTWLTLTAGANNILDVYPDPVKHPLNKNQGVLIYSNEGATYGYNGGYYFVSMGFSW